MVLVEGASDQAAVETLARRLGRDLEAEGVSVVPMGGASAIGEFLTDLLGAQRFDGKLAGLCDEGEVDAFRRGLERVGFGSQLSRAEMEALGFYVCVVDLEDELIRSLGVAALQSIFEREGEAGGFRTFQNQPAWRERPIEQQIHRFLGISSGRKIRYGRLLVEALDLGKVPRPLEGVLMHV